MMKALDIEYVGEIATTGEAKEHSGHRTGLLTAKIRGQPFCFALMQSLCLGKFSRLKVWMSYLTGHGSGLLTGFKL